MDQPGDVGEPPVVGLATVAEVGGKDVEVESSGEHARPLDQTDEQLAAARIPLLVDDATRRHRPFGLDFHPREKPRQQVSIDSLAQVLRQAGELAAEQLASQLAQVLPAGKGEVVLRRRIRLERRPCKGIPFMMKLQGIARPGHRLKLAVEAEFDRPNAEPGDLRSRRGA